MKISKTRSNYFIYQDDDDKDSLWVIQLTEELRETLLSFTGMTRVRSHENYRLFTGTDYIDRTVLKIPQDAFNYFFEETTKQLEHGMGFIHGEVEEMEWLVETYGGKEQLLRIGTDGFFFIGGSEWHMPNPMGIDMFCSYCFDMAA